MRSENEATGLRAAAGGARVLDARTRLALEALRGPREVFDSAVASASERLRGPIEAQRAGRNGRVAGASAELGRFASGRIDFERFAAVFDGGAIIPPADLARIVAAHDVLADLVRDGVAPHVVTLRANEELRMEIGYALARIGRVFGAARAAVKARAGMGALRDEAMIAAFAFRNWNRAEKAIAPPLVVEMDGADLRVDGLGDFLDGQLKIVLVVRGAAPVAALAEVITPSVFIAQMRFAAGDESRGADAMNLLGRLAAFDGPGIVALLEGDCAEFVHDPSRPRAERLAITHTVEADEHPIGHISAFRQAEAARLLEIIGRGYAIDSIAASADAGAAVAAIDTPTPSAPDRAGADLLAAWLLKQADVPAPAAALRPAPEARNATP